MIRFWVIRSLMRDLNSFRGQNPHISACIRMAAEFGLFDGLGCHSDCIGSGEVRPAGGGDLEI